MSRKRVKASKVSSKPAKRWHAVPLKASFMAVSILGFFISIYYIFDLMGPTWGLTFLIFFVLMFIASMVSMTKAPID